MRHPRRGLRCGVVGRRLYLTFEIHVEERTDRMAEIAQRGEVCEREVKGTTAWRAQASSRHKLLTNKQHLSLHAD